MEVTNLLLENGVLYEYSETEEGEPIKSEIQKNIKEIIVLVPYKFKGKTIFSHQIRVKEGLVYSVIGYKISNGYCEAEICNVLEICPPPAMY